MDISNSAAVARAPSVNDSDAYVAAIVAAGRSASTADRLNFDAETFLRAYYRTCAPDILRLRDPANLARAALDHRAFTAQPRVSGEALFRVLPAHDGAPFAVLETCVDDSPFLVDSVTLSLRAIGATLDLAIHPVLKVGRAANDELIDIDGAAGIAESWIHIEFLPLVRAADYAALEADIGLVLADLRHVVADYPSMRERVSMLVEALAEVPPQADAEEFAEAREFLNYLDNRHFTFLGYVPSAVRYDAAGKAQLEVDGAGGLGLLRPDSRWASQTLIAPQSELEKYAESPRVIVITKASLASPVHRADLMDVVSIKRFDRKGTIIGIVRFVGLLASEAYSDRPPAIPLVRRKADQVMRRSGLPEASHDGKSLRDILHGLPRDELFQSSEDELFRLCMGIRGFTERQPLRVFMRRDRYGRFYSFLVYLPRDRYSRELRDTLGQTLLAICEGNAVDRTVEFQRGGLTRVHYIIRTAPGTVIAAGEAEVERRLAEAALSWRDQLRQRLLVLDSTGAVARRFGDAFPTYYSETFDAEEAELDTHYLLRLTEAEPLLPRLQVETSAAGGAHAVGLKLYARGAPVPLSDVLPTLENFGLRVIRQEPAEITPKDGPRLWVEEFEVQHPGCDLSPADQRAFFEAAFLDVWRGVAENDGLNRLVLGAGLDARQVTLLRAICKYLIQTGLPFSESYMQSLLAEHAAIARLLALLFENRFVPGLAPEKRAAIDEALTQQLAEALDGVASLDGDRVLRAFLGVVRAALRTNGFQKGPDGRPKPYLSIKLDPSKVPELPLPKPMFEIWVYAPEVEGVHLRGSRVARGGLRWSDRRQDFRIEVLGLMKAQMVKNVVIVPSGAKGGFVVKKPIEGGSRDALQKQGVECYRTFLRGLLDITDNYAGRTIVPPPDVVRYDDDDPYLVVAADKGTATFSDTANEIAAEYGFWLGDAFASGGSAGYDHKKMGITARGAWESVKRHFREMGQDAMQDAFTTVGIGDMSGDVFGNGMLLSRAMRLVAAFDHRHIFIDPTPAEAGFDERARLFALPRSSWADYDASLISAGGGVFPRSAKQIRLSPQAREALAIAAEAVTPAELMRAILKAPVDLLWNGGIGTYVKAERETALDIGDRANDAIRVNGRDLRCKVVGEGGNLGFTQLGRIEYATLGGRINTDAIDNAGGVHTSDREVNIKIPLNQLMREGRLTQAERDPLLAACTGDIEQFVLRDNYVQSAGISLMAVNAAERLDDHTELMRILERQGLLNRPLEFLPDDETLQDRRSRGLGLTRPEISVLIAYGKISLDQALLASDVPDDAFFHRDLLANFPKPLVERFPEAFAHHRLARQIVATVLSNAVVNRMGAGFAQLWADDHGLSVAEVVKAYATAHQIFGGDAWWRSIEAEDNRLPALTQYRLMNYPIGLLKHATGWLTVSAYAQRPVKDAIDRFTAPIADLNRLLPEVLPAAYRDDWNQTITRLRADGVEESLAVRLANTRALGAALDIVELAEDAGVDTALAAASYFLVGERFRMLWLYAAINGLQTVGKWQSLARVNLRDDAYQAHRQIASRVLRWSGASAADRLERWVSANDAPLRIAMARIGELQATGIRDFATLSVNLRELRAIRSL